MIIIYIEQYKIKKNSWKIMLKLFLQRIVNKENDVINNVKYEQNQLLLIIIIIIIIKPIFQYSQSKIQKKIDQSYGGID